MKNYEICPACFRELDTETSLRVQGGGFAYDVGRLIRFAGLAVTPMTFPMALYDAIYNEAANQAANG